MYSVSLRSRVVSHLRVWTGLQRMRERNAIGGTVLMYHGVVAREKDPLLDEYTIDAASFRSHLAFFLRCHDIVPLKTVVERLQGGGEIPSRWLALTLDDALASQVTTAAEILGREGIPWALAVPAGLIGTGRSIWTNELRFLVLQSWPFPSVPPPVDGLDELPTRTMAERRAAVRAVLSSLFRLEDGVRAAYIEGLIDRAGRAEFLARLAADTRFTLATWPEIERVRASGVEILSHGWHHRPQNAAISQGALIEEIFQSRRLIGERCGEPPAGFALPHGAKTSNTDALFAAAGYTYCVSSRPQRVAAGTDDRDIPRFAAEYPLPVLRRHMGRGSEPSPRVPGVTRASQGAPTPREEA